MRSFYLSLLVLLSFSSKGQVPVDSLEIKNYVDSINSLVDTWTSHDPVLSVDVYGKSEILHKDGSRFLFDMRSLKGENIPEEGEFNGITMKVYDPRTRPAEQHFLCFTGSGASGGLIRFDHIPEKELRHIFELCVALRRLFL